MDKFNNEHQVAIRRNAFERVVAISHHGRHRELADFANLHAHKALVPAFNHLSHAHREFERLFTVIRVCKIGSFNSRIRSGLVHRSAIDSQVTFIMDLNQLTCSNSLSRALLERFNLKRDGPSSTTSKQHKKKL